MKTLYYTVEIELEDCEGTEKTTGFKDINLYKIEDNKPLLITSIQAENQYATIDELNHFIMFTITEEDNFGLDLETTYLFDQL
jgi:hypothetical protein